MGRALALMMGPGVEHRCGPAKPPLASAAPDAGEAHTPTPSQADLNSTIQEGPGAFYGVSSQYSSADSMTISVSTKVCSFGKQVVEKVEVSGGPGWHRGEGSRPIG